MRRLAAMRYSIVQGPRQSFHNTYSGAARIFCLCAYHGRPCTIYEDGRQRRDYVNVDDVVDANLLVLSEPAADGRALNVGGGHAHTVLELAEQVPAPLEWVVPGEYRYGDTRHIVSDVTEMRRLGWEPRRTPADSLRAYLDWLADLDDVPDVLEQGRRAMLSGGVVRRASAGAL